MPVFDVVIVVLLSFLRLKKPHLEMQLLSNLKCNKSLRPCHIIQSVDPIPKIPKIV